MTQLMLMKTPSGSLIPAEAETAEVISHLKIGSGLRGNFKKQRNPKFHRLVFALFSLAFDAWDAPALEYKGQPVKKDLNRFRRDLTILAGHYEAVTNLRGEVRLEAKSISYANMDQSEFELVFRDILNVVWDRVLKSKGYESPEKVAELLDELLRFE